MTNIVEIAKQGLRAGGLTEADMKNKVDVLKTDKKLKKLKISAKITNGK